MPSRYLAIYLNDHLAGATAGLELARRALRENEGRELGEFLRGLVAEIAEDRETLLDVMKTLGAGIEAKRALWLALGHACDFGRFDLGSLAERAGSQRERLEPFRLTAAAEALA